MVKACVREEHKLQVFENNVIRNCLDCKTEGNKYKGGSKSFWTESM